MERRVNKVYGFSTNRSVVFAFRSVLSFQLRLLFLIGADRKPIHEIRKSGIGIIF
jgi:hypothetical protein